MHLESTVSVYPFGMIMPGRSYDGGSGYRYGFNGMEKEKGLADGIYSTFYRGLDSRIGRWLSTDPVVKSSQSPYVSMSNNPILRIDPRGDDDYFDQRGNFLYSTQTGNNIMIKLDDGDVKRLSEVKINTIRRLGWDKTIRRVGTMRSNMYLNKMVYHYFPELDNSYRFEEGDGDAVAFANGDSEDDIAISLDKDNFVDSKLDDINNFKSTIIHEDAHTEKKNDQSGNWMLDPVQAFKDHLSVYLLEIESIEFEGTTESFQHFTFETMETMLFTVAFHEGPGNVDGKFVDSEFGADVRARMIAVQERINYERPKAP